MVTDAAPYRYAQDLALRPIDPFADNRVLTAFGRGLYRESTGDDAAFMRAYGLIGERFAQWIAFCGMTNPAFASFLTENRRPIGMAVMGLDQRDPSLGRLHHLYMIASRRGQGFGGLLDDYVRETLRRAGATRIVLNVAAGNARAIRFYDAQGWADAGASRDGALRYMRVAL